MYLIKKLLALQMLSRNKKRSFPIEFLEQKHTDPAIPLYNDSSFFYGGDHEGNAFICRMAFRGNRKPEAWFDFYLKDIGYFGLRDLPGPESDGFRLGSLYWKSLETGRVWEIGYKGLLTTRQGDKHEAEVRLTFTGRHPVQDFAACSDRKSNASAIAGEKWNKEFFEKLKELSQTHYEQSGKLTGTVKIAGKSYPIDMRSMRDHSFGPRSWHQWDRHYWMSGINDEGRSWTVTTIRYDFIDRLTAGFITEPDGSTDAISKCTGLEDISKDALWPQQGVVDVVTRSGKKFKLEFERPGHFPYVMDNVYYMLEGIGRYRLNGVPGLGMIEFGFNKSRYNIDGIEWPVANSKH